MYFIVGSNVQYSGPDQEVYCKKCHGEKFGVGNPPSYADLKAIVAKDGDGCPRLKNHITKPVGIFAPFFINKFYFSFQDAIFHHTPQ